MIFKFFNLDQRAVFLKIITFMSFFCILSGLYLVLCRDVNQRAEWLSYSSAINFNDGKRDNSQAQIIQAIEFSPFKADLWLRLAEINNSDNPHFAKEARYIAYLIDHKKD